MFKDMVCVFVGPNDFLSYNNTVAALCSDYRITGNAGVHLKDSRKLTDDEIEKLLLQVERLGEGIDERPPTEDENDIIHRIQTLHPEVRYIIQSFHKVEAADKEGPGYKVKYKDTPKKEAPKKEAPKKEAPKEAKKEKAPSKEKGPGWTGILMDLFELYLDPTLSKEERQLMREEQADERKELIKLYKKNKAEFEKLDKVFKENTDLYDYIGEMVDADQIDAASLSAFTTLVTKNPDLLDSLNISTKSSSLHGDRFEISDILYDLLAFEDVIPELRDLVVEAREDEDKKSALTNKIADLFEDYFGDVPDFDIKKLNSMRIDMDNEVLALDTTLKNVLTIYEEAKLSPYT